MFINIEHQPISHMGVCVGVHVCVCACARALVFVSVYLQELFLDTSYLWAAAIGNKIGNKNCYHQEAIMSL